jgi:hypothetical protein
MTSAELTIAEVAERTSLNAPGLALVHDDQQHRRMPFPGKQ